MEEMLSLIVRLHDALPLAHSLYDESVLLDSADKYMQIAIALVRKLQGGQNEPARTSVETVDSYSYHYITEGPVCYLTMCESSYPKEQAFKYLSDLKTEFECVDGDRVERASRSYELGTFKKEGEKVYNKAPQALVNLCMKSVGEAISSATQLRKLEAGWGRDLSHLTDGRWRRFYEQDFGPQNAMFVKRNLARSGKKVTWAELYDEKKSSDQFISSQQSQTTRHAYAAETSKKRSTVLLTGEEERGNDDGVDIQVEMQNNASDRLVEFAIVGPLIPPPGLVETLTSKLPVVLSTDETIPGGEGRIYRVSCHESSGGLSPSTMAVTQLFQQFNNVRGADGLYQSTLLSTHQSKELDTWSILFGAQMSPILNGHTTMITISGNKYHLTASFTRLVFHLRRCFFAIPVAN